MTLKNQRIPEGFWPHQFHGLSQWGRSFLSARSIPRKNRSRFFAQNPSQDSSLLVIVLPGVGGSFSQFFFLNQYILQNCPVDLVYLQPQWGQTLKEQTLDLERWIAQTLGNYPKYLAIGHSRGGLLGNALLNQSFFDNTDRALITMATPWQDPQVHTRSLRAFLYKNRRYRYFAPIMRWSVEAADEIFSSHCSLAPKIYCFTSRYDPIVGDESYQKTLGAQSFSFSASHMSMPFEREVFECSKTIILKHLET